MLLYRKRNYVINTIKIKLKNGITVVKWIAYFVDNAVFLVAIPNLKRKILKKTWEEIHSTFQTFGQLGLKIFGIKAVLVNNEKVDLSKQYIVTANHRSWFDQVSLMALFPRNIHFLAKADYFKVPFFKYCLRSYECIAVFRKQLTSKTTTQLNSYLDKGENVLFFVEGTRGAGRSLLSFKKGAFKKSAETGIPILPTYILGSEQCLSKKNTLLSVKKGNIVVIVGKPVYFQLEKFDDQFKEFESMYRKVHDKLYFDFDQSQSQTNIIS